VAFGAVDYKTKQILRDDSKIEWDVYIDEMKDLQVVKSTPINYHICTEEDYDDFYPVVEQDSEFLKKLRDSAALYCIDADQPLLIRGTNEIDSSNLNIDLKPCSHDMCANDDLDSLKAYLGNPELVIYQNKQRFDSLVFSNDCIVKESKLWNQHIDLRQPNWMLTYIEHKTVVDEIEYLHIGITEDRNYFDFYLTSLQLSYADDFAGNNYKIAGFSVFQHFDKVVFERTSYDTL
jgi:hypothetical protein